MFRNNKLIEALQLENKQLQDRIDELEDEYGWNIIKEFKKLASEAGINVHADEYQTFMMRVYMDVVGRKSEVAKAYSKTAFVKDNPEEVIERLKKLTRDASIVTSQLEDKTGKKK